MEMSQAKLLQVLGVYMDWYLKDIDEIHEQLEWEFYQQETKNDAASHFQECQSEAVIQSRNLLDITHLWNDNRIFDN